MCNKSEHTITTRSTCLHQASDHEITVDGLRSAQPVPARSITPDHQSKWEAYITRSAWHRAREDGLRSPQRVPASTSAPEPLACQVRVSENIRYSMPIETLGERVVSQGAGGTDAQAKDDAIRLLRRRERRERREAAISDDTRLTQNRGSCFASMLGRFGGRIK